MLLYRFGCAFVGLSVYANIYDACAFVGVTFQKTQTISRSHIKTLNYSILSAIT
nr:MAG TPA: hypothetical protein [Caudoviricetes sp.]